ncbi:MAG: ABC transporter permease, partial [Acidobacteria bacterium]|nr:ABC transporter permease [Acidobacteriota bacterium]
LGIGIGSNTAMFSVVDGILLKPLPFAEPERIIQVREKLVKRSGDAIPLAAGNFYDYRAQAKTADLVAFRNSPFSLISPTADPERYVGVQVSEGWFKLFGVQLARGRDFTVDDYREGQDQAVILSYGLWRDRFASDEKIVGREINLNGRPRVVVGVAGETFDYPAKSKIWAPLVLEGFDKTRRDLHSLVGLGRLKPGVELEQARTELSSILSGMAERFPEFNADIKSHVTPLMQDITGPIRPALMALLGAVGFVLAIACANVANLLLARGAARQQEMAVRVSLGASRWNLISQMLVESFVLSAGGGALGIGLAYLGLEAFQRFAPKTLPRVDQVALYGRVLLFALGAVALTALLFGVLPALRPCQRFCRQERISQCACCGPSGRSACIDDRRRAIDPQSL